MTTETTQEAPAPVEAKPQASMQSRYPWLASGAQASTFEVGGANHPWRRYFAKTIDILLVPLPLLFVMMFALFIIAPGIGEGFLAALDNLVGGTIAVIVLLSIADAILLSTVGTTPGRAIFGIRVRDAGGDKLDFPQALKRAGLLGVMGMGLGIPIVALFTQYFAYKRLDETGSTRWDDACESRVTHAEWGSVRAAIAWTCGFLALVTLGVLNVLGRQP